MGFSLHDKRSYILIYDLCNITVFIPDKIMCLDRCSAVGACGMHSDNIDSASVIAGFLIDDLQIAGLCLTVVAFTDRMKIGKSENEKRE